MLAVTGRRRAGGLLIPIGLAVIVIALVVDVPKGLDEGAAAVAYEGASASLLEGFWIQLAAAAVLIALRAAAAPLPAPPAPTRGRGRGRPGRPCSQGGARRAQGRAAPAAPLPKARPSLPKRTRPKRKVQGAGT